MHRLAECFVALGRAAYIIQDDAAFHPGWFDSKVNTISRTDWLKLSTTTLSPSEDVLVIPETFLFEINTFAKNLPVVIFCQNASYIFGTMRPQSLIPNLS